jgi:ABC-type thiamine transport system ATPase subunit
MKIRHIKIERFRGIRELEWRVGGDFVCLVGPGDSTKTTILDAVEFALSPRWNIPFDDSDFYDADTSEPIVITVTVGELPEEFKSDAKYGYLARGWAADGTLHDEPAEGDELVLSIQLRVDPSLEQSWTVVNDRNPEGKPITAKDREKLGCARLGDFLDRHFSWGRGSVLSRLTGEADSLSSILAEAGRAARDAVTAVPQEKLQNLHGAAQEAKRVGEQFGVAAKTDYRPQLDMQSVSVGVGGISLHDGDVPLRRAGLGTRRLLAVAMQREVAKDGGVTLIDEVEQGLEPHRIRHLLRVLRGTDDSGQSRHVLMTTHAPVVLEELKAEQLRVVRAKDGVTQVFNVDPVLQPIIRRASGAFLARKVLVCEGKTEIGLCRRLDQRWSETGQSFALSGVAIADGNGEEAPKIAKAFADLGYDVALLGDSDKPLNPDRAALEGAGAKVILWDGGVALEQRVVLDLPYEGVAAVVELAMANWSDQSIRDAVASRLGVASTLVVGQPADWIGLGFVEADMRKAIGAAAKDHKISGRTGWFKRVDLAEELAGILIGYAAAITETDLCRKIVSLKEWAHGHA